MANRTATLYIRITTKYGRNSYCKPVYLSKGRLKPHYAMVDGEPEHHPEGVYYIRFGADGGKQQFVLVGKAPYVALDKLEEKKLSVVLIAAFDRVARSVKHFLALVDELDSLGVELISRRENVTTSGPIGRLFLTIIGSIAELESDLIRERVLAGMRRAKLDGVRIGRAPMNIDRAAIVRDRIGGMSLTAVAKKWGVSRSLVCKLVNRASAGDEGSVPPQTQVADLAVVPESSPAEARW